MTQPRRGLGRGLDALFGGAATAAPPAPAAPPPAAPAPEPESAPAETTPTTATSKVIQAPAAQVPVPPVAEAPPPAPVAEPKVAATVPVAVAPPAPVDREPEPAPPAPEPVVARFEPPAPPPPRELPVRPVQAVAPTPVSSEPLPPPRPLRRGGPEMLDIDLIAPNPEQPRTHFEPEKLRELADSIRQHGIIQPLVVCRDDDGGVRLIAGERRLQAARLAGHETVPVIFKEVADAELLELALIENIQRADLNAIEEALAYRRLIEEYGMTQEEAARRVGKSRSAVANALRLLALEPEIRRSLVAGEITEGHARALLGLPESKQRMEAWREVIKRRLSVRDVEALVRRTLANIPVAGGGGSAANGASPAARRDAALADIEARLRRHLSTRVAVQPQKRGARITIECYSAEEFDHVIDLILEGEDE